MESSTIGTANRIDFRIVEYALIVFSWIALFLTLNPRVAGDGTLRYLGLLEIAKGNYFPPVKYSLLQSYLSYPLMMLSDFLDIKSFFIVPYFNIIVFFVGSLAIVRCLRKSYGAETARLFLLIVTMASMFPHHLRLYYGETLTAFLLLYGFMSYKTAKKTAVICIGLSVINTPALLPALVIASIVHFFSGRKDYFLLISSLIAGSGILLEAILKYGSLFQSSYFSNAEAGAGTILPYSGQPGFSYPLFFGLLSILFSFGKGIVFFIPGLFALCSKRVRDSIRDKVPYYAGAAFAITAILTYSKWWAWYGGVCWGPRFFLFLSLLSSIFLAVWLSFREWNKAAITKIAILVFSLYIAANGYLYGISNLDVCWAENYRYEYLTWYVPEFSVLWRPFVVGFQNIPVNPACLVFVAAQVLFLILFLAELSYAYFCSRKDSCRRS
jgi:hypothetical protein